MSLMARRLRRLWRRGIKKLFPRALPTLSVFRELGFHSDQYLLGLVDVLLPHCAYFVETGTHVGSTLAYVARTYPGVTCLSCEPSRQAFRQAVRNTRGLANAFIYNEDSETFLERLGARYPDLVSQEVLFWLDAHGQGFRWPLRAELAHITGKHRAAYVLIDDFQVPGRPHFGYDTYQDQSCSYDYIQSALNPKHRYDFYYPDYAERTSTHEAMRGWVLIDFGHERPPEGLGSLQGHLRHVSDEMRRSLEAQA